MASVSYSELRLKFYLILFSLGDHTRKCQTLGLIYVPLLIS